MVVGGNDPWGVVSGRQRLTHLGEHLLFPVGEGVGPREQLLQGGEGGTGLCHLLIGPSSSELLAVNLNLGQRGRAADRAEG